MSSRVLQLKVPAELQRELQIKSRLLESTIDEFTRTTSDLSRLSHDMTLRQIDDFGRVAESPAEGFWSRNLEEFTSKNAKSYRQDDTSPVEGSTSDPEVTELQVELGRLCRDEAEQREVHKLKCAELQDSWDKLVAVRAHMASFRAGIEEMSLEDIHQQAMQSASSSRRNGYRYDEQQINYSNNSVQENTISRSYYELLELGTDDLPPVSGGALESLASSGTSLAAADRLVNMHILKEKVRSRDVLRHKSHLLQQRLDELRGHIDSASGELSQAAQLGDRVPHSLTRAMSIRERILALSQQLEEEEAQYVSVNQQLLTVEDEVSRALSEEAAKPPPETPAPPSYSSALNSNNIPAPSSAVVKCEFSLDEVLLGKAKLSRMNGEAATQYRSRLQRRLASISVLAVQLQEEVQEKAKAVKFAQDALKEAEVRRLRHELQIANICSVLHRKQAEARLAASAGATSHPSDSSPNELHQYRSGQLSGRDLLSKLLHSKTTSGVAEETFNADKSLPSSWLESALGYRDAQREIKRSSIVSAEPSPHAPRPVSPSRGYTKQKSARIDEAVNLLLSTASTPQQPPLLTLADLDEKITTPALNAVMTPPALQEAVKSQQIESHDEEENVSHRPRHHRTKHRSSDRRRHYSTSTCSSSSSSERPRRRHNKNRRSRRHYSSSSDSTSCSSERPAHASSSRNRGKHGDSSHRRPSSHRDKQDSTKRVNSTKMRHHRRQQHRRHSRRGDDKQQPEQHVIEESQVPSILLDTPHPIAIAAAATPTAVASDSNIATQLQQLLEALSVHDQSNAELIKESLLAELNKVQLTPARSSGSPHHIRRDPSPVHDAAYYYSTKKQPFHRIEARFAQRSSSGILPSGEPKMRTGRNTRSVSPPRRANTVAIMQHDEGTPFAAKPTFDKNIPLPPHDSPKSKWVSASDGHAQVSYSGHSSTTSATPVAHGQKQVSSPITSPMRLLKEKKRLDAIESDYSSDSNNDSSGASSVESSSVSDSNESFSSDKSCSSRSRNMEPESSVWLVEEITQPSQTALRAPNAEAAMTSQLCKYLELLNDAKVARSKEGSSYKQSMAQLRVTAVSVRNLPEMKRMTRTADSYVRMQIGSFDENASLSTSQRLNSSGDSNNSDMKRTQTKWGELYPQWKEEEFRFTVPMKDKKSLKSLRLCFHLMDAAKSGEDVHIGTCWLPLKALLDQRKHSLWLRVDFSDGLKKQRVIKMNSECALRVDAQLTHNRIKQLQQKIKVLQNDLTSMSAHDWVVKKKKQDTPENTITNSTKKHRQSDVYLPRAKRSALTPARLASPSPTRADKTSRKSRKSSTGRSEPSSQNSAVAGITELISAVDKSAANIQNEEDDLSSPTDVAVAGEDVEPKPQAASGVNLSIFRGAGVKIVPSAKKRSGRKKIGFLGSSEA